MLSGSDEASFLNHYALPTPAAGLGDLIAGPGGALWFTETHAGKIGSLDPVSHAIHEYAVPDGQFPVQIAADADGELWFTTLGDAIGSFDPKNQAFSSILTPSTGTGLAGITAAPDGHIVFAEYSTNRIGVLDPATRAVTEVALPIPNSGPNLLTVASDGAVWFTQNAGFLGKLVLATGNVSEVATPAGRRPGGIIPEPNDTIGFVEDGDVGIVDGSRAQLLSHASTTWGIDSLAADRDGRWWVIDGLGSGLALCDPASGQLSQVAHPDGFWPNSLVTGSDGNLWFVEPSSNTIGVLRLDLSPAPTITSFQNGGGWTVAEGQSTQINAVVSSPEAGTPTGTVTFTIDGVAKTAVALHTVAGQSVASFTTPPLTSLGSHSVSVAYDGDSHFSPSSASGSTVNVVSPPVELGSVSEVAVPLPPSGDSFSFPGLRRLIALADGNVWFINREALAEYDPATKSFSQFVIPGANIALGALAAGADGRIWFTSPQTDQVGVFDPLTHASALYSTPTDGAQPADAVADTDGRLWFDEANAGQIAEYDPASDAVTEYPIPAGAGDALSITVGPDGNLWFAERDTNKIAAFDPAAHTYRELAIPDHGIEGIASGPDGHLWLTNRYGGAIYDLDPKTGMVRTLSLPFGSQPGQIVTGPDGALWFIDEGTDSVGRIDPATGIIKESALFPIDSRLWDPVLAEGSDGDLWIEDSNGRTLDHFVPTSSASTTRLEIPALPLVEGQPVSVTAVVSGSAASVTPGSVVFTVDGHPQPPVALTEDGSRAHAAITMPGLASGVHTIGATYQGDGAEPPSASALMALRVESASPPPSTIRLRSATDAAAAGQLVTVVADVLDQGGATPTGWVSFTIDGAPPAALPVVSRNGGAAEATLVAQGLTVGTHAITATYNGDANARPSTSGTLVIQVDPAQDGPITFDPVPVPAVSTYPSAIVYGPGGQLWFTDPTAGKIGSIDPVTRTVSEFPAPAGLVPREMIVGPDGNLWFTDLVNQLGMLNPTTHATAAFLVADHSGGIYGLTAGSDGKVWFLEPWTSKIGSIDPSSRQLVEYTLPRFDLGEGGMVTGADGNLWFPSDSSGIVSFNPRSHAIVSVPLPVSGPQADSIVAGPDGDLWFLAGGSIGTLNPLTHVIQVFWLGPAVSPAQGIAFAPDGNPWFAEPTARKLGFFDRLTHAVTEIAAPGTAGALAAGPAGTLWYASRTGLYSDPVGDHIVRAAFGALLPAASVQVSASPEPAPTGQPFTVTAVVSGSGGVTATGSVTFTVDGQARPAVPLATVGGRVQASLELSGLSPGAHAIAASFGGDTNLSAGVSTPIVELVGPLASTTQLVVAPASVGAGQPVVFAAVVTGPGAVPGGSVTFTVDGRAQPAVPLQAVNGAGLATFVSTGLSAGSHSVVASYSGDPVFAASASGAGQATVAAPPADGPTVLAVRTVAAAGHSAVLVLTFSESLDPATAQNASNYRLVAAAGRAPTVAHASYDPSTRSVTLVLSGRLNPRMTYRLTVVGTGPSGVRDTGGLLLDGAKSGHPGSDATTVVPAGSTPTIVPPARAGGGHPRHPAPPVRPTLLPRAVDRVLPAVVRPATGTRSVR